MTVEDMMDVLAVIRAGMPNAYLNMTEADAMAMANVWAEMFADYPADLVMAAAKTFLWNDTTGRFPSPGAIRSEMEKIMQVVKQCAYGYSISEYMGAAADRFPRPVRAYMESLYRKKHQELYGYQWTSQQEKARIHMERLKGLGDGNKPKLERRTS